MGNERLTYFSFDEHNTMRIYNGEKYKVSTLKDGRIQVIIDEGFPNEKEFYLEDATIFDELKAIVDEYKMDKYKSDYQPRMRVFDGDSWSLYYKYDSKRTVSSGGYMAWPDNYRDAHNAITEYFKKWREYEVGVKAFDYFKFTSKNNKGRDLEYTLERGENEATMTLRNAEHEFEGSFPVSNDYLTELQQLSNSVNLKDDIYDYHTSDEEATKSTYFVRYNTGDTLSGYTCYNNYPSHKESAILEFFGHWLPVRGNLVKLEYTFRGRHDIKYYVSTDGERFSLSHYDEKGERHEGELSKEEVSQLQELIASFDLDIPKNRPTGLDIWTLNACYDSKDSFWVAGHGDDEATNAKAQHILEALTAFFEPHLNK